MLVGLFYLTAAGAALLGGLLYVARQRVRDLRQDLADAEAELVTRKGEAVRLAADVQQRDGALAEARHEAAQLAEKLAKSKHWSEQLRQGRDELNRMLQDARPRPHRNERTTPEELDRLAWIRHVEALYRRPALVPPHERDAARRRPRHEPGEA